MISGRSLVTMLISPMPCCSVTVVIGVIFRVSYYILFFVILNETITIVSNIKLFSH